MADDVTTTPVEPTSHKDDRLARAIQNGTSLFTLVVKVFGLGLATHEAFFVEPPRDAVVLAVAAFMMAGAVGIDSFVGNILGKK